MRVEGSSITDWWSPERWTVVARVVISLSSACVLCAAALVSIWVLENVYALYGERWWLMSFFAAAVAEGAVLVRIWKPARPTTCSSTVARPLALTIITATATIIGCALAEVFVRRDDELVMGAVGLLGGAGILMIWLPALNRLMVGRRVVDDVNTVNVFCPACGYSLVGLRDLRCPECGASFTIDELIRSQNYTGVKSTWRIVGKSENSANEQQASITGAS